MSGIEDEVVVRGPSTRPREVRGAGYRECFTREALVNAVEQVASGYVKMNVEHLDFLPPIGHWHRAEVEDDEQGESELVMYGHYLPMRGVADFALTGDVPEEDSQEAVILDGVTIGIEPRNFDPDVWEDLKSTAPLPVVEHAARSALPPLIWLISIPTVAATAAAQLSGSFLKRLGENAADKLIGWISGQARRARENSRDSMVEVQFEIADNVTVSAFIELTPTLNSSVEELRRGLDSLGSVAVFADGMKGDPDAAIVRLVAFFYCDGEWKLGWWATEEDAYLTTWFQDNHPDPRKFLSGPYLVISNNDTGGSETAPPSEWIG